MAHKHSVYDTDLHFKIDPITGAITDESTIKKVLKQNDHNSERRTFEIPRYIDGHDTSLCNKVYIHYLNIDAETHEENPGLYPVEDMQLSPEDENVVIFSWLLSRNVTKYAGSLSFLISFLCVEEDGEIVYQWSTDINSDRGISKGMNNSAVIVEKYADVIEAWRQQVIKDVAKVAEEAAKEAAQNISYNDLKDRIVGDVDVNAPAVDIPMHQNSYIGDFNPDIPIYFVSDQSFTINELTYAKNPFYIELRKYDDKTTLGTFNTLEADNVTEFDGGVEIRKKIQSDSTSMYVYVVNEPKNVVISNYGATLTKKGIYFTSSSYYNVEVSRLYRNEGVVPGIKKLDNKYFDVSYNDLTDKPYGEDESLAKTYRADTYSNVFNGLIRGMKLATTDIPTLPDLLKFYTFDALVQDYISGSVEEKTFLNESFEGASFLKETWGYRVSKMLSSQGVDIALINDYEAFNVDNYAEPLQSNGIYLVKTENDNMRPDGSMYSCYMFSTALHRLPIKYIESKYLSMPLAGKGVPGAVTSTNSVTDISGFYVCPIINGIVYYKDTNTTYTNLGLGQGYLSCTTQASNTAKTVSSYNYVLSSGGIVAVKFTYDVPADSTLNINSKGAKPIYYRGANITANVIKAGDIATFIYSGSQYVLLAVDRWHQDIADLTTRIAALETKA